MTTAARPTWAAQRGGTSKSDTKLSSISKQSSVRDITAHTKLKLRQPGQGTKQDVAGKDFLEDLNQREEEHARKRVKEGDGRAIAPPEPENLRLNVAPREEDADDPLERDDDEDDDNERSEASDADGGDDDDEDDTEELMRELQRIKKERLEEQARKEAVAADERERINLTANPLMRPAGDFSVKRRWDDDVVFKNCAKQEKKQDMGFINDTLRSQFHRKFMSKYII